MANYSVSVTYDYSIEIDNPEAMLRINRKLGMNADSIEELLEYAFANAEPVENLPDVVRWERTDYDSRIWEN